MIRIESPLIAEWEPLFEERNEMKRLQEAILSVLETRFGSVPEAVADSLQLVADKARLSDLLLFAMTCPNLESFRIRMADEVQRIGNE